MGPLTFACNASKNLSTILTTFLKLKHDGFRAIAYIEDGESGLVSRNLKQFNFLVLSDSLAQLHVKNRILDGEVVCLDNQGVSQFNHLISRRGQPIFYAFDLLWLNNQDLRRLPLVERKKRLEKLVKKSNCRELPNVELSLLPDANGEHNDSAN